MCDGLRLKIYTVEIYSQPLDEKKNYTLILQFKKYI